MSGAADVHKAVASLWEDEGLDTKFKSYWSVADQTRFTSLNDGQAPPNQPFPYCVFESTSPDIVTRMSADGSNKRYVNDNPWTFFVYAKQTDVLTAKEFAIALANEILKVFGGHPTQAPASLPELDNGSIVIIQYRSDYGERQADDIHLWTVEYNIRTDVPVTV